MGGQRSSMQMMLPRAVCTYPKDWMAGRSEDSLLCLNLWPTRDQILKVVNTNLTVQSPPGRLQAILTSPGPIFIVVGDSSFEHNLSVAQRLAHILHMHHRLDCEIVYERTAFERTTRATWTAGNIVFVGPQGSIFASNVLAKNRTPVHLADGVIHVGGQAFNKREQGLSAKFIGDFSLPDEHS